MNNNIPKNVVQLITASREGNLACVQALLAKGLDPNSKDGDGWSPLMWAAMSGREEVVELLLGHSDINLEARSQGGTTALFVAAAHGHPSVVQQLLAGGADPEARNVRGVTALLLAAEEGHLGVVEQLLAGGADAAVMDTEGRTPLWWALKNGWVDLAAQLFVHPGPVPFSVDYSDSSNISSTDSEDSSA